MLEHDGAAVAPDTARGQLGIIAAELAGAIANQPLAPARTLGVAGFELSAGLTLAFIDKSADDDGAPSGWQLADIDEDPGAATVLPTLTVRKGLPGSVEVGARSSWLASTRQGVVGVFARAAPVEGYEPWPDLSFQVGYSAYVGNPELKLSTVDLSASLGGTFAFGSYPGIRQAQFSPYIGGGVVLPTGRTVLDEIDSEAFYAGDSSASPEKLQLSAQPKIHGGLQVTNSTVLFRMVGGWSPQSAPTFHAGMGFMF